jgi:hypothetical protein
MIDVLAFRETQAAAAALGIELQSVNARTPRRTRRRLRGRDGERRADAMHVVGNPANFKNAQTIADFALRSRLPSSYEEGAFALVGGLLSYAASYPDLYFRAADLRPQDSQGSQARRAAGFSIRRSSSW